MKTIGILALQGAVDPHRRKFLELGARVILVRKPVDLDLCDALVLPGGESTTMLKLLRAQRLWEPLKAFAATRKPVWGVCAGAILLAREVESPRQESLQLLNASIVRNAYGRQLDSSIEPVMATKHWGDPSSEEEGVFIRAPRFGALGKDVQTLFTRNDDPVMVREQNILASTFHPELSPSLHIHRYFMSMV